jgi:hypothetical protein
MTRFYFHLVTDSSRCEDDTGTILGSLEDVLPHSTSIAQILTKYRLTRSNSGREPKPHDYLEVEDQDSNFVITLPFVRLLKGVTDDAGAESRPIDLAKHRLARRYLQALPA